MTCSVCSHPARDEIDHAVVTTAVSNRQIAAQHGLGESAIRRHEERHLPALLVQAQTVVDVTRAESLLAASLGLEETVIEVLNEARARGDLTTTLKAVREARGLLGLRMRVAEYSERQGARGRGFGPLGGGDHVVAPVIADVQEFLDLIDEIVEYRVAT